VTLYHLLKLFQSDSSAMPKKTVVSEFYDEMVQQQQLHDSTQAQLFNVLIKQMM